MVVPQIPLDLVSDIAKAVRGLEDSYERLQTFVAMTLVCRAWASVAKEQLWRETRLEHVMVPKFMEFLKSGGSGIVPYLQGLQLWRFGGAERDTVMSLPQLETLLDLLPDAQMLSLDELPYRSRRMFEAAAAARAVFKPQPRRIGKLRVRQLIRSERDRIAHLVELINAFAEIDRLEIEDADFKEELYLNHHIPTEQVTALLANLSVRGTLRARVRSFCLKNAAPRTGEAILEVLRLSVHVHELTSIRVDCVDLPLFASLCSLLHEASNSISEVTLDMPDNAGHGSSFFPLWKKCERKMAACTSIRSLTVRVYASKESPSSPSNICESQWLPAVSFLSRIPTNRLTFVRFILGGHAGNFMRQFQTAEKRWKLANVLKKIDGLESVRLTLLFSNDTKNHAPPCRELLQPVEKAFQQVLAATAKDNSLKVDYSADDWGPRIIG